MTARLTLEELRLGPTRDLCALNYDDPPFSFKHDCHLPEPKDLPASYLNPKLDMHSYWGPSAGSP